MNYLYRISTKKKDVWSRTTPKPIYFVTSSKESAIKWAEENLNDDLAISKITRLAEQIGGVVFKGQ